MIDYINAEDIELFKNILNKYKKDDIYMILNQGFNDIINTMNKKTEQFEYYININNIKVDIFLFPLIKLLIYNSYEIKSCSYYQSKNNYCSITFASIDNGLLFINNNISVRNLLYKRVESSLNNNIKNKWSFFICPYKKDINSNIIDISFTFIIPNNDIILLYDILNKKEKLIIPQNIYFNLPFLKKSKYQLIQYINEINNIKLNNNNIIVNKILDKTINNIYKMINKITNLRSILHFNDLIYKINDKLLPLVKELLTAQLEINDNECYYDNFSNTCCISFSFHINFIDFLNIILNENINDDLYKRIFNLSNMYNWIYETYIVDINIKNKLKPDFFPSINIIFNVNDLNILYDIMLNYNIKKIDI
jgi:hypothetical protein